MDVTGELLQGERSSRERRTRWSGRAMIDSNGLTEYAGYVQGGKREGNPLLNQSEATDLR